MDADKQDLTFRPLTRQERRGERLWRRKSKMALHGASLWRIYPAAIHKRLQRKRRT